MFIDLTESISHIVQRLYFTHTLKAWISQVNEASFKTEGLPDN